MTEDIGRRIGAGVMVVGAVGVGVAAWWQSQWGAVGGIVTWWAGFATSVATDVAWRMPERLRPGWRTANEAPVATATYVQCDSCHVGTEAPIWLGSGEPVCARCYTAIKYDGRLSNGNEAA